MNRKAPHAKVRYFEAEEKWDVPAALEEIASFFRKKRRTSYTILSVGVNIDLEGEVCVTVVYE